MSDDQLVEDLIALATADLDMTAILAEAGRLSGATVYRPNGEVLTSPDAPDLPLPDGWPRLPRDWRRKEDGRPQVAVMADDRAVALLSGTSPELARIADVAGRAIARAERHDDLARQIRHFSAAQRISHVGSYDFDIARNANDWSDQLYRIYGREPQSFMATYEKFLEMVHPDDREKIVAVHQEALAKLAPYDMEERIVWPDGSVRTLASWGEVVAGPDGTPARMIGICWDITEQKQNAAALTRSSQRFQRLIHSAPDVVLVVSAGGVIQQVNPRVTEVLGWAPEAVVGRPVTELLPDGLGNEGPPREVIACNLDGTELPVEVSTSVIETDDGAVTAVFVRDLRDRKRSEELSMRLHDADVRRRHALEINDNVVQGLASVLYLLDLDRHESAHAAARRTMAAARAMMDDLLEQAGPTRPGELVRGQGHGATLSEVVPEQAPATGSLRVVLADDAEDIRLLLRLTLGTSDGFDVVGEAANGREAIEQVTALRPDVILLDLSMPVMDGLQAIPELLQASPETKIVILSGFDEGRMKPVALELGAHAYLEKGEATSEIVEQLAELFPEHGLSAHQTAPKDPDDGLAFDGDMVVHELRTPLTVITGMLSTLRERMDQLPSATTHELLDAATRNARQMAQLLDAVSDARRADNGLLSVVPERTDLSQLVRDAVADVAAGHVGPPPVVHAEEDVVAAVDPTRIRQVIANLLSNAVRFAPTGTPITVRVSRYDRNAEITVHDAGPGVPEDHRDELFTKFGRLGQTGHGMGLGLFISRAIARAHGGELALQDGPGATFALTLPLRSAVEVGTTAP